MSAIVIVFTFLTHHIGTSLASPQIYTNLFRTPPVVGAPIYTNLFRTPPVVGAPIYPKLFHTPPVVGAPIYTKLFHTPPVVGASIYTNLFHTPPIVGSPIYTKLFLTPLVVGATISKPHADLEDHAAPTNVKDLYLASLNGELENVRKALESSTNINVHYDGHFTPLMAAAQRGHVSVVQALIDHGANIEETLPSTGDTALRLAALSNQVEVVRVLLRAGANVNVRDKDGFTPLMAAAQEGHVSVVQALHEADADLELKESGLGATALYIAAQFNQTAVVRKLLQAGANDYVRTKGWYTPLMLAAEAGHVSIVEALLNDRDIAVDLVDLKERPTALHYAAWHNQPAIAQLLLNKGADVNGRIKAGTTPLMLAAEGGHVSVVEALLNDRDIAVDLARTDGRTALHYAAEYNQPAITQLLLNKGADKTKQTNSGNTPAAIAGQQGNQSVKRIIDSYKNK